MTDFVGFCTRAVIRKTVIVLYKRRRAVPSDGKGGYKLKTITPQQPNQEPEELDPSITDQISLFAWSIDRWKEQQTHTHTTHRGIQLLGYSAGKHSQDN